MEELQSCSRTLRTVNICWSLTCNWRVEVVKMVEVVRWWGGGGRDKRKTLTQVVHSWTSYPGRFLSSLWRSACRKWERAERTQAHEKQFVIITWRDDTRFSNRKGCDLTWDPVTSLLSRRKQSKVGKAGRTESHAMEKPFWFRSLWLWFSKTAQGAPPTTTVRVVLLAANRCLFTLATMRWSFARNFVNALARCSSSWSWLNEAELLFAWTKTNTSW